MNIEQEIKQISNCVYETESNSVHPFNNVHHPQHEKCKEAIQQLKERKSELVMQRAKEMFH